VRDLTNYTSKDLRGLAKLLALEREDQQTAAPSPAHKFAVLAGQKGVKYARLTWR
jgi:hypothetical protein